MSIELCSARSLVVRKCLWFDVDPGGVSSVNVKYNKLIAEKRVEDASEYIWLRLDARSVLKYKSKVSINCVPREVWWSGNVCDLM